MRGFRTDKNQYILGQVKPRMRILHVGCTNAPNTQGRWRTGTLLHKRLCDEVKRRGAHVVGVDIDADSLVWLQNRMPDANLRHGDAHQLRSCLESETSFDLVIAADVIEHLPNPGLFLESCREVLAPSGRILITTCNAFGIGRFAKALFNYEAVHPEHIAYFSHRNLTRLCFMSGLKAVKLGYYKYEPQTKFSLNLVGTNLLEQMVSFIYPQFSEGVVVEARSEAQNGSN